MTRHNESFIQKFVAFVVNCFQKLLSSWHDTTFSLFVDNVILLWIAFKNYYLRDTTQRFVEFPSYCSCCELLSKIIIFVTRHNFSWSQCTFSCVVNCFQKLLSSWHDTTYASGNKIANALWIAFKNYYLRDTTQPVRFSRERSGRCELLSKIIIFVTRHNWKPREAKKQGVVNCFQKLLSSWHDTTRQRVGIYRETLWIAFKNYYLRDTTQLKIKSRHSSKCCELLSKIIIFVTRHNQLPDKADLKDVVNCFQKLLSSWHDTTIESPLSKVSLLWIAFKNYYLRDTTQL